MGSLVGNANLIKKVYFRRDTLVARDRAVVRRHLPGRARRAVRCGAWSSAAMPLPWLPLVLVFVVMLTMFALGLGLALSVTNVYFRDTQHFVGIAMQLWFYATPIVYPISLR